MMEVIYDVAESLLRLEKQDGKKNKAEEHIEE